MAIESNLESIKNNGGEAFVKRDQYLIRKALVTTEFTFNDFIWEEKSSGLSILDWITYELGTVLSASVLAPFVEKLLELKADDRNDQRVRSTGDVSIYHRMLSRNSFIVFDACVQIERICHTVKTEMEYRMQI